MGGTVFMRTLLAWWRKRQLRLAQEKHAYWKAHAAALAKSVNENTGYGGNPWNRGCLHKACGLEAKYMERVECLMREQ